MAERTRKTPRQRAEEALGVATRKVQTLTKKRADLIAQRSALDSELEEAKRRLEYVKKSPDLAEQTTVDDQLDDAAQEEARAAGGESEAAVEAGEQPDVGAEEPAQTGEERPDYQK